MASKKYQVFVSSTFRDLAEERQTVIRNILDLKHIPAGMELFPASDIDQMSYIRRIIDECDYYVLLVGGRYGSLDAAGVSFTEREYDYAVDTGKVVLAFVHDDPGALPVNKSDVQPDAIEALDRFRSRVMSGRLVRTWPKGGSLEVLVLKALIHAFNDMPQVGWIRGDTAASDETLAQANKALEENASLKTQLADLGGKHSVKFENLADLSDVFRINFDVNSYYQAMDFSWKEIFLSVASRLNSARTATVFDDAVQALLVKKDLSFEYATIDEDDLETIRVQLVALNLIDPSRSTIFLTREGEDLYVQQKVVRKS